MCKNSFLPVMATPSDLSILLTTLPPMIARKDIGKYLGGLISSGYLANLDSEGRGPKALKSGRRVVYIREDLVAWLQVWLRGTHV